MSKKTQNLFNAYVAEGREPGKAYIKRVKRNDGESMLVSSDKWGHKKYWRDSEGGIKKAQQHSKAELDEGLRDPEDNPCWKGYEPVGTKKKNGKTVPNCVPVSEEVPCSEPITTDPDLPTSRLIGTDSVVRIFKAKTPGQTPEQIQEGLASLAARGLSAARGLVSRVTGRSARNTARAAADAAPGIATTRSDRVVRAFPQSTRLASPAVSGGLARRGIGSIAAKGARFFPGLQTLTGLGMAGYNAYKGDWVGAGLSLGSAIPGPVGWGFAGAEIGRHLIPSASRSETPRAATPSQGQTTTARRPQTDTPGQSQTTAPAAAPAAAPSAATPGQPSTAATPPASTASSNIVRTVKTKGGDYNVYRKDSDEAKSFRSEFARNRRAGAAEFTWQGRKYSTAVAESKDLNESFELAFDYQDKPQPAPTAGQLMMQAKGAFAHHTDVQNVMDVQSIKESIQKQFEQTVLEEDTELLEQKREVLADMVERALETIEAIKESNVDRDAWSEAQILKLESYIESVSKYLDNISEDSVPVMRRSYMRTDPRTGERKRVWGRPYKRKRDFDDEDDEEDAPKGPRSV